MLKVYISFTTISSRIVYIDETLKSVDVPDVYEIHLNLQSEFKYPEKEIERLKSITLKLKIFWSTGKYITMSKSIPTLEKLFGTNSLVLVVDDDMEYYKDYIQEFINSYDPNLKELIGGNKCKNGK